MILTIILSFIVSYGWKHVDIVETDSYILNETAESKLKNVNWNTKNWVHFICWQWTSFVYIFILSQELIWFFRRYPTSVYDFLSFQSNHIRVHQKFS